MSFIVEPERTEDGYTFADVRDANGKHVGRIVKASETWGPDAALHESTGLGGRWPDYEAAKAAIEGQ